MTLARKGELLDFLKKLGSFDEEVTRFYGAEVTIALKHLHSIGVIHRDLKPENILLSENMHILISDFGSSKILQNDADRPTPLAPTPTKKSSFVGTAQYVSPEILTSQPSTPSCDLWALGCIIYHMLSGLPPFRAQNEYLVFQKIIKANYDFPDGFNQVARDLVSKLLVVAASERLGAKDFSELEGHEFFIGIDWVELPNSSPPDIMPFLPATLDNEAMHSSYTVPDDLQPGLDDRQISRILSAEFNNFKTYVEYILHLG